jgi:4-hydroxybenzoyl-CoA reductase subunit beta
MGDMMSLPKFQYLAPRDLKEACAILKELNGKVAVCAGGTELVMHLKRHLKTPEYILSLKNIIPLNSFYHDRATGFIIGAASSLGKISANNHVKTDLVALAQASEEVAIPQIRNRATLGGNVCLDTRCWYYDRSKQWRATYPACYKAAGDQCHVVKGGKHCYALFQADTVPSLFVLKAKLKLVKLEGERVIPIEEFYSGRGEIPNRLSHQELLTEIHIPPLPPHSGTVYLKYRKRDALEFPILGIAAMVTLDNEGKYCKQAMFAIVGHDSKPLFVEATDLLTNLDEPILTEDLIHNLLQGVKPINHMGMSGSLKRYMAGVLLKKAFLASWKQAQKGRSDHDGRY